MNHLTAVGVRQGSRRVVDDGLGGVDREPPFVVENGVERATLDVLHDEEDNLRRLFEGEDRRDVPVAQRRGDPRFAPKPLDRRLTLQQGRRQDLDRDFLVEGISWARYTSPMPPRPRMPRMSCSPSVT